MNKQLIFIGEFSPIDENFKKLLTSEEFQSIFPFDEINLIPLKDDVSFDLKYGMFKASFSKNLILKEKPSFDDILYKDSNNFFDKLNELKDSNDIKVIIGREDFDKFNNLNCSKEIINTFGLNILKRKGFKNLKKSKNIHEYMFFEYVSSEIDEERFPTKAPKNIELTNFIVENKLFFAHELSMLMKEKRYLHSYSVAKTAYEIAIKQFGFEVASKAYLAGLFHDCGKDLPILKQQHISEHYYSMYMPCPSFAYHQFVSAYLAKVRFHILDDQILSAISFHCTGKACMTTLEKIIYSADKVEPTREFETKIEREECIKDIEKGFVLTLQSQKKYFIERNMKYMEHFLSKEMYSMYMKEN